MPTLENELETYRRELPGLLAQEGKFVLIHGDKVISTWTTHEDAIQQGYSQFKLEPFLVKRICAVEPVYYFTRDIIPACRSSTTR